MTFAQWLSEFCRRLVYNEGAKNRMYLDTATPPCRTIGCGFNLERADAIHALETIGVTQPYGVLSGALALSDDQVRELLEYSVAPIVTQARVSLQPLHFDLLSDGRKLAVADLVYNLGEGGWLAFAGTRALIDDAVHTLVRLKDAATAHALFGEAAQHLRSSDYAKQVGNRALRNAEMIETSQLVPMEKTY